MKRALLLLLLTAAAPDPVVAVHGTDELTASQVRALIADAPPETRHAYQTNPDALKALIVANEYLESEVCDLMQAVSHAYARGRFKTYTG